MRIHLLVEFQQPAAAGLISAHRWASGKRATAATAPRRHKHACRLCGHTCHPLYTRSCMHGCACDSKQAMLPPSIVSPPGLALEYIHGYITALHLLPAACDVPTTRPVVQAEKHAQSATPAIPKTAPAGPKQAAAANALHLNHPPPHRKMVLLLMQQVATPQSRRRLVMYQRNPLVLGAVPTA